MSQYGLNPELHAQIARELYDAEKTVRPVTLLTERYPHMTQEDSYAIQREGLKLRLADGAKIVGRKIGITSRGMMKQLNCDTPDFGCLLAHTEIAEGGACKRDELNVPIVEGELAFIMGEDLDGGAVSAARVAAAIEAVSIVKPACAKFIPAIANEKPATATIAVEIAVANAAQA